MAIQSNLNNKNLKILNTILNKQMAHRGYSYKLGGIMSKSSKIKIGGLLAIIVAVFLALIPVTLKLSNYSK